ncbi:MAG: hypothetical protein KIT84_42630 [Labilithrix sp.]|nr:hypothetical protein [Labilithrix sp.]MCW5817774.1 hypothetical protein [Labilithrix sp.]
MKRLVFAAALALLPTLYRYEGSDALTFACHRDGDRAGACYLEPTLFHRVARRLGAPARWRPEPAIAIDDLGVATPAGDGTVTIFSRNDCWTFRAQPHSFCRGRSFETWRLPVTYDERVDARAESAVAHRLNRFIADARERTFVHPRPRPFAAWHLLFYVAATALAVASIGRARGAKTRAWLRAIEAIPPAPPLTPYRG